MNILILNWRDIKNPLSGGAEIVTHEHAKTWVNKGHHVTWFTSRFSGSLSVETVSGVRIIRKGNSLTVFFHASIFYLFSREKFDIVIDEIHGIPFFTPLYVRKPKIAFIHEVAQDIWDYMYPFPVNKIGKIVESLYFNLYKSVPFWTDAPSTISDLARYGIKKSQSIAIPCPITNEPLKKIPIKEKDITFISVGRLVKMKGIEDVIQAFSYILKDLPKSKLWIVGDGDDNYKKYLQDLASRLGIHDQITFFGKVSDLEKLELMSRAHVFLHASVREGWGLVILESASQGTPAVVYNVSGLKDTVRNGETGIVVEKNTPECLARSALDLTKDSKRYLSFQKKGLKWVKSLAWKDATDQSLAYIESIASLK